MHLPDPRRRELRLSFVGTDIDPAALANAERIVAGNRVLAGRVELRLQRDPQKIFAGVTAPGERFAACVCNPPFHASAEEADAGTRRKLRNLGLSMKRDPARIAAGATASSGARAASPRSCAA